MTPVRLPAANRCYRAAPFRVEQSQSTKGHLKACIIKFAVTLIGLAPKASICHLFSVILEAYFSQFLYAVASLQNDINLFLCGLISVFLLAQPWRAFILQFSLSDLSMCISFDYLVESYSAF